METPLPEVPLNAPTDQLDCSSCPFVHSAVIVGVTSGRWWISGLILAASIVIALVRFAFVGRSWRSWGYVERDDDLYITHGVMFRNLIAVPYGRMQLVEVESGPLERAFGLATVTLKTASPRQVLASGLSPMRRPGCGTG